MHLLYRVPRHETAATSPGNLGIPLIAFLAMSGMPREKLSRKSKNSASHFDFGWRTGVNDIVSDK